MAGLISIVLAITLSLEGLASPPVPEPARTSEELARAYAVEATLDVPTGRLDAVETIHLENRAALPVTYLNLSVLPRAFGFLESLGRVTVDDAEAPLRWTTSTNLRIRLPRPLASGDTAALRVPFRLIVGSAGGAFTARLSRDAGVLSFGQWLPMISPEHEIYAVGDPRITRSADRIRLELRTTAPLPRDAVACAGMAEAPAIRGRRWVCEVEHARDVGFVVNPRFRLTERVVDGTRLRVYTETVDGSRTAELASDAMRRLNRLYGAYPWPDLVLAEVGAFNGFSMEYPAMIHLTRQKVVDTYVVYHEVAHMWFYAQLGNDQMREPWLDEGFADFTARHLMGIGENQCSTRPVDSPVFAWPAGPTTGGDWLSCDGYFHAVFYRGTEFLNTIRRAMGDETFFGALRGFIAAHRFEMTTADALLSHLERSTDADLEPIFARYLGAR